MDTYTYGYFRPLHLLHLLHIWLLTSMATYIYGLHVYLLLTPSRCRYSILMRAYDLHFDFHLWILTHMAYTYTFYLHLVGVGSVGIAFSCEAMTYTSTFTYGYLHLCLLPVA